MLLTRLVAGNARGTLWFFPQLHRQYRKPAFEVPIAELLNPDFNLRIEQPLAPYFLGAAVG